MEHPCVRSVEKKLSSIGKTYFQLKVSVAYLWGPPEELLDFYHCDTWIGAKDKEYVMNLFASDENTKALKWCFKDYYEGIFEDVTLGLNIGELNAPSKHGQVMLYNKSIDLYSECQRGLIKPGCLLCGTTATLNVEPYKYDGKLVSSYTRPIFWAEELSSDEMRNFIEKIFAKNGKIVSKIDKTWDEFNGPVEGSSRYSDGYGGYLDDHFIDDAFGGEADAYWNID